MIILSSHDAMCVRVLLTSESFCASAPPLMSWSLTYLMMCWKV